MGVFANNAITDAGRILEGELKMGAVFTPTRIVMGSGFLPSGTTARTIKDVISPVISLQINKKNMSSNGTVIIGGVYSNAEIQSDFYFRELALYAKAVKSDGSATDEILYSYGNAGNAADLMPAYTSETAVEKQIDLVTYVGIDVKVDLTIESGIYVTQKQLEDALNGDEDIQQILNEHIANKQNPHGVTAAQVGAYTKAETNNLINTHINNKQNPHSVTAAQVGTYTKTEITNLINTAISESVVTGSYIGDGTATRFINLGFTPKAVLLLLCDGATMISASGYPTYFGGLALIDKPVKAHNGTAINNILDITTNGFNVHFKQSDYISSNDNRFSNNEYYYIAIR